MNRSHRERGAAPVARLRAFEPWQIQFVRCLRLWGDGPDGRAAALALVGADTAPVFTALLTSIVSHARRPHVCHSMTCDCVGADEAVLLQIVTSASEGFLDDAAMMAALAVFPSHAERIALLAGEVGCAFRSIPNGAVTVTATTHDPAVTRLH